MPVIGVAATPLLAKHAVRRARLGAAVLVPPGQNDAFLAPQPVESLELVTQLAERLMGLGLRTVGDLARVPLDALQAQLGGIGQHMYQLARESFAEILRKKSQPPTCGMIRVSKPVITTRRRYGTQYTTNIAW